MEPSKSISTGLSNEVYDLVLVLQQAAADAVRYSAFADDVRLADDRELANWFDELAASDRDVVDRAKSMLASRLGRPV